MRRIFVLSVCFCSIFSAALRAAADGGTLLEAGVPALSREWSGDDYRRAAEVLASGKVPLPQLSDEQGKAFLQRLTSAENLSLYRDRSLPIEQRVDHLFKMMEGASTLVKQYVVAANKGANVHTEVAQVLAFSLRTAAIGAQLLKEFLPTFQVDGSFSVRMTGLKQAYGGFTSMFAGAEASLSEKNFYSADDLSLLLEAMAQALPSLKQAFVPGYKIELRKKLDIRSAEFQRTKDAQNIKRMVEELGS